jgi:putative sigma-54 modulation protein
MIVNLTGDNITLTPALKEFSKERIEKLKSYNDKINRAEILIKKEGIYCIAEINATLPRQELNATAKHEDMYQAIDGATKKMASQLRKLKTRRMQKHKGASISQVLD